MSWGGGWRRWHRERDGEGAGGAGQGSGVLGGGAGSSVTCPPLTRAICCRERDRRRGGGSRRLEKTGEKVKERCRRDI